MAKTFEGEETIALTVLEPAWEIVLNAAADLEPLEDAEIKNDLGFFQIAFETTFEKGERWRLRFRDPIPPGTWRLRLRFRGLLTARDGNQKLEGFYISTYKDGSGADRVLATTQFEPMAARQAFPCWDEPDFRAVFALTLVVDPALRAVSNTAVVGEYREGDKKVIRFACSIPMSTYLVAFVVGNLKVTDPVWVVARRSASGMCRTQQTSSNWLLLHNGSVNLRSSSSRSTTNGLTPVASSTCSPSRTSRPGPWKTSARSRSGKTGCW